MMIFAVIMTAIAVVMMPVMIATRIGIILQRPGGESPCRRIRGSADSCIELYPCIFQRHAGTHAYASAYEGIDLCSLKKACKRSVAEAAYGYSLTADDLSAFFIVQHELFRVSEMLEYFSVFVS